MHLPNSAFSNTTLITSHQSLDRLMDIINYGISPESVVKHFPAPHWLMWVSIPSNGNPVECNRMWLVTVHWGVRKPGQVVTHQRSLPHWEWSSCLLMARTQAQWRPEVSGRHRSVCYSQGRVYNNKNILKSFLSNCFGAHRELLCILHPLSFNVHLT